MNNEVDVTLNSGTTVGPRWPVNSLPNRDPYRHRLVAGKWKNALGDDVITFLGSRTVLTEAQIAL